MIKDYVNRAPAQQPQENWIEALLAGVAMLASIPLFFFVLTVISTN